MDDDGEDMMDFFSIGNQIPCGVVFDTGIGFGTSAATLVDDDDAEMFWIEKAAAGR